jgi:hypothetical protein
MRKKTLLNKRPLGIFALRIQLVPKATKIIRNNGYFDIEWKGKKFKLEYLRKLLLLHGGVSIDKRFKHKSQRDCYYICETNNENICIELNYGDRGLSKKLTRISVVTQPRIPSPQTFGKYLEIVKYITDKTFMKIIDSMEGRMTTIEELQELYNQVDPSLKGIKLKGYKDRI